MTGDFVFAFLLLGGGLGFFFLKSASRDREAAKQKEASTRRKQAAAQEEARKYQEGTPLVCLSCNTQFCGPLTEAGCPKCRLSSLVMTKTQRREAEESGRKQN